MTHYEERLQEDLKRLQDKVSSLGETVERAVGDSVRALLDFDQSKATEVIIGDLEVNRVSRDLDRLCHGFVARHLPAAGHLRYVSSIMRVNVALERIGDYAETISRTVLQLSQGPSDISETLVRGVEVMSEQSLQLFHQSMKAFSKQSADAATTALQMSTNSIKNFDMVLEDLVRLGDQSKHPTYELFALLACFNRLERIIHQSKNICEECIFAATGKMKSRKKFNFLFIDKNNNGASLLAQAMSRRSYPTSGQHYSCGYAPQTETDAQYISFATERGLDIGELSPKTFEDLDLNFKDIDIVIALEKDAHKHLPKAGFHTINLHCPITDKMSPAEAFEEISAFLEDLILKLRGEDWDDA